MSKEKVKLPCNRETEVPFRVIRLNHLSDKATYQELRLGLVNATAFVGESICSAVVSSALALSLVAAPL